MKVFPINQYYIFRYCIDFKTDICVKCISKSFEKFMYNFDELFPWDHRAIPENDIAIKYSVSIESDSINSSIFSSLVGKSACLNSLNQTHSRTA